MRDACPIVWGRMRESFCRASMVRACIDAKSIPSGIEIFSRRWSFSARRRSRSIYPRYLICISTCSATSLSMLLRRINSANCGSAEAKSSIVNSFRAIRLYSFVPCAGGSMPRSCMYGAIWARCTLCLRVYSVRAAIRVRLLSKASHAASSTSPILRPRGVRRRSALS